MHGKYLQVPSLNSLPPPGLEPEPAVLKSEMLTTQLS